MFRAPSAAFLATRHATRSLALASLLDADFLAAAFLFLNLRAPTTRLNVALPATSLALLVFG